MVSSSSSCIDFCDPPFFLCVCLCLSEFDGLPDERDNHLAGRRMRQRQRQDTTTLSKKTNVFVSLSDARAPSHYSRLALFHLFNANGFSLTRSLLLARSHRWAPYIISIFIVRASKRASWTNRTNEREREKRIARKKNAWVSKLIACRWWNQKMNCA